MRFARARRLLKPLLLVAAFAIAVFAVFAAAFAIHCSTVRGHFQASAHSETSRGIPGYARPEDDTFLTYAEWYIVWSYKEKASWQQSHLPSGFPYLKAIGQYWSGYCCSYGVVRGRYPFNFGDHLMLTVIGTSFTLEYVLKGAYENTVGRLTEWASGSELTEEDRYAAHVAQDYGSFVQDRPFYEFPFFPAFRKLWAENRLWGVHPLRKWERKLWLSLDYGLEGIYCGLIELASHATYGVEEDITYAVLDNAPETFFSELPAIQRIASLPGGLCIVKMPRYRKFTDSVGPMLRTGAHFVEIAGNRQIMVTAIVPRDWTFQLPVGELLFASEIPTDPGSKRVALRIPVASLDQIVDRVPIEHIYDY